MSREKQIEEMADIISSKINGANFDDVSDAVVALYDADYRRVILCKNCEFCEQRYPVKEIGEEAKESWYCYARNCRVEPEEYCSFAKMKGGE